MLGSISLFLPAAQCRHPRLDNLIHQTYISLHTREKDEDRENLFNASFRQHCPVGRSEWKDSLR